MSYCCSEICWSAQTWDNPSDLALPGARTLPILAALPGVAPYLRDRLMMRLGVKVELLELTQVLELSESRGRLPVILEVRGVESIEPTLLAVEVETAGVRFPAVGVPLAESLSELLFAESVCCRLSCSERAIEGNLGGQAAATLLTRVRVVRFSRGFSGVFEAEAMLLSTFSLPLNTPEPRFLPLGVEGLDGESGSVFSDVDDVFRVASGIERSGNLTGCNVMSATSS